MTSSICNMFGVKLFQSDVECVPRVGDDSYYGFKVLGRTIPPPEEPIQHEAAASPVAVKSPSSSVNRVTGGVRIVDHNTNSPYYGKQLQAGYRILDEVPDPNRPYHQLPSLSPSAAGTTSPGCGGVIHIRALERDPALSPVARKLDVSDEAAAASSSPIIADRTPEKVHQEPAVIHDNRAIHYGFRVVAADGEERLASDERSVEVGPAVNANSKPLRIVKTEYQYETYYGFKVVGDTANYPRIVQVIEEEELPPIPPPEQYETYYGYRLVGDSGLVDADPKTMIEYFSPSKKSDQPYQSPLKVLPPETPEKATSSKELPAFLVEEGYQLVERPSGDIRVSGEFGMSGGIRVTEKTHIIERIDDAINAFKPMERAYADLVDPENTYVHYCPIDPDHTVSPRLIVDTGHYDPIAKRRVPATHMPIGVVGTELYRMIEGNEPRILHQPLAMIEDFVAAAAQDEDLKGLLEYNQRLVLKEQKELSPSRALVAAKPQYLLITCSDAGPSIETYLGLQPNQVTVVRNPANQAFNAECESAVEHAINTLEVKHILVCGHYDCGSISHALAADKSKCDVPWMLNVLESHHYHAEELGKLQTVNEQHRRMVELNATEQVVFLYKMQAVMDSVKATGFPKIHALVFDTETGLASKIVL